jgi:O-antigen/teichoic acid export membrane protein
MPLRLSKFRLHPFFTDVLLTGVTQVLILLANLFMVSLVSNWMGLVALGEYLLLKRVSAWLLTATQLGLGVALPREIAHACEDTKVRAKQYFAAALVVLVPLLAVVSMVALLASKTVAQLCFGSPKIDLVYALVLLLTGSCLQTIVFAYYRGLQRMRLANFVQLGGLVAVPLLAFAAERSSHSPALLIEATGIGMAVISIVWAVPIIFKSRNFRSHFVPDAGRLLGYGVVRVPGDIACGALLTLGPVMVSHYTSMEQLSYMLLGVTCLSMASLAFWPVVMLLLAKVSNLLGAGRSEDVKEYVQHLRSAVIQLSALVMTQAFIFVGPLARWWLGASYLPGLPVICIIMFAIPGFMYYYTMRSVLDAASTTPYNTRNVMLALAIFCAVSVAVIHVAPREWILLGVSAAMTIALYLLAIATDISLRVIKLVDRAPQMSFMWVVALLAAVSLAAQLAFHFEITKIAFCAILLINMGLALLLMRKSRPEWVTFVSSIALSRA